MSDIVKVVKEIIDFADLQKFASAQYNTLIAQSKKIHKLEEDIEIVRIKLSKAEALSMLPSVLDTSNDKVNDAETTCLVQLAILKSKSMMGELTLEETKKVEIYAKTLNLIRTKKEVIDENAEKIKSVDTEALLLSLKGGKAE